MMMISMAKPTLIYNSNPHVCAGSSSEIAAPYTCGVDAAAGRSTVNHVDRVAHRLMQNRGFFADQ